MFCFHLRTANQLGNRVEKKNHTFWSRAGGTPLYRYVPSHRVGFLRRFGLKTGIQFAHFGLESSMVFERSSGMYERIFFFNPNE